MAMLNDVMEAADKAFEESIVPAVSTGENKQLHREIFKAGFVRGATLKWTEWEAKPEPALDSFEKVYSAPRQPLDRVELAAKLANLMQESDMFTYGTCTGRAEYIIAFLEQQGALRP